MPGLQSCRRRVGLLAVSAAAVAIGSGSAWGAGVFSITPTNLIFPVVNVGSTSAPLTVTVSNGTAAAVTISNIALAGPNAADFTITAKTCGASLGAGASCTVTLTFHPSANDIRRANLNFTDSAAGSPQTVSITGTGQAATQSLTFSPAILVYPVTTVGVASAPLTVQVSNFGGAGVTFSGTSFFGTNTGDFSIVNNSCTSLPASVSSCSISVGFAPTANGPRSATLQINSNAAGGPFVVPLFGTSQLATQSMLISPPSSGFGVQNTGSTSSAQSFSVQNLGTVAVTMSGVSVTGTNAADFGISSNGCPGSGAQLQPNGICFINVTFSPTATGTRTASLSVADSATGSPQTVPLYGVGRTPTMQLAMTPAMLDLGVEPLQVTSGATYVQVQNFGTSVASFTSVALGGTNATDFSISSNSCTGTLNAGSYCYVYVTFTPTATGTRTATLSFSDNATGSPQSINVAGSGSAVTTSLAFNYLDYAFGALAVGSTTTQRFFEVFNYGNSPVVFNSISLTGTNAGDFSIASNGCPGSGSPLSPGTACFVFVTFTPSAVGLRTANLLFSDGATGSPQSIVLDGVGLPDTQTLTFSVPALIYPGLQVGSGVTSSSVTVTNTGDEPVSISNVSISGSNAGDFTITSNGCPSGTVLGPNLQCTVFVQYQPSATGIGSASLQFTDNATGSPQTVPMAGDGEPAGGALTFNSTVLNVGSVNTGSSTISNTLSVSNVSGGTVSFTNQIVGPNAADYSLASNTCTGSLTNGNSCNITVKFAPGGLGLRLAALQVAANGVNQQVLLGGIGTTTSSLLTLQSSLDFGQVNLGSSSSQVQFALQNTGTTTVTFSGAAIGGVNPGDFAVASNTCSVLAVGQTCDLQLVFTPSAGGPRSATLQITDTATGSPQSIALTGLGQTAGSVLGFPGAVDLGRSNVGTPVSSYVTVTSDGTSPVTLKFAAVGGTNAADFNVNQNTCTTISPLSSCSIQVTFNPSGAGVRSAVLKLFDTAAGSPQSIVLMGVGITPAAGLAVPSVIGYPATIVGAVNYQSLILSNVGTAPVSLTNITINGTNAADFSIQSGCGFTQIPAGSQCGIQVAFVPAAAGFRTATLVVSSNAAGSPQSVTLTGVGQAPVSTLSMPPALVFPATTGGSVSTVGFYLYNTGNQTVTFSSVAVKNSTAYTVGNWCPTLGPGGACFIQVAFTPTVSGVNTAVLQFTDTAVGSPQSVLLNGAAEGNTHTVALSATTLTYSAQAVGTVSGVQTLFFYNNGTGPVTFTGTVLGGSNPGDFVITANSCLGGSSQVAAGSTCYLQVAFAPKATGARAATITVTDNAVGGTQTVGLTGTGQ